MLKQKPISSELVTMLFVSIFFHGCIVAGFALYTKISSRIQKPKDNPLSFVWVHAKSAKPLSEFKDKLPPPIVPPPAKPKPKEEPKPKVVVKDQAKEIPKQDRKKPEPKKERDTDKDAISKALSAIYSELGDKPEPRAENFSAQDAARGELASFFGSGGAGEQMSAEKLAYINTIREILVKNWFIINKSIVRQIKDPVVILSIKLNADGYIVSKKFERRSGNAYYDNSVIRALEKSDPFPAPSEGLRNEVLTDGIIIEFNPPLD